MKQIRLSFSPGGKWTGKFLSMVLFMVLLTGMAFAQQKTISGKITDESGAPVPGATVVVKGTTIGIVSDIDGNYSVNAPATAKTLVFSFIGMKSQEVLIGNQTTISVKMASEAIGLEEVVAIGYGVQKKKLTTGATVQVRGDNLQKLSTVSVLGSLQSQTPGVNITQSSGQPGEMFKVTIRGLGTVGNSAPLYVIDGVAGGDINALSTSDIESIDVLKDAASAAIYGARAANGVILVTTKQGKTGKMQVSYDGYYGVQNVYKMTTPLNAKEYMQIMDESAYNNGLQGYDWAGYLKGGLYEKIKSGEFQGTNWLEETRVKNAPTQSHAINIAGGNETSKVSLGFSYSSQEGTFGKPVQSEYDRYTARINSEHIILKQNQLNIITVGENLSYTYSTRSGVQQVGNIYGNDIHNMLVANPLMPLYDKDGKYFNLQDKKDSGLENYSTSDANPIGILDYRNGQNLSKNHNLQANAYIIIQPIKDLKFKSSFGYRMSASSYRSYVPTFLLASTGGGYNPTNDNTQQNMGLGSQWQIENTLAYAFKIRENAFDAVIGQSAEKYGLGENMNVANANNNFIGFKYAYLDNTSGYTAGATTIGGSPWGRGALTSFFSRLNWNLRETYMVSATVRADGSSNFARGNRWGYFPSVSGGWVITNENFMKETTDILNFMKLRASWGQNGNCNINNFQYLATIGFPASVKYSFGNVKDSQTQGAYQDILANPNVTWETSEQLNIGFDARILHSRLGIAFDWYNKKTKDWLVIAPSLATNGTNAPYINGGDVENKGLELAINWNDKIGDFTYGVSVNLARNKNKVTRIANSEGIIHGQPNVLSQGTTEMYRAEVGKPIGYFWGYKTEGIYQNQAQIEARRATKLFVYDNAQPGDVIFADLNKDGVLDDKDKTEIGDPHPDLTAGLNLTFGYKGFDLAITTTGNFGQQIAKSYRSFADSEKQNYTTDIFGRWYGEGTSNKLPRLTPGTHTNWQNISDIYIEDGDYMKIQNLTVGYDFKKLFPKMVLAQARLFFTAQNLYTFTNYSGMDPEVGYGYNGGTNANDSNWSSGIDLGFYPSPRTYLIGVNLKF